MTDFLCNLASNDRTKIIAANCEPNTSSPDGIERRTFVSEECGARGFSTGSATFRGSAELPCHVHPCGEAITILAGHALVIVEGHGYRLWRLDRIHIPVGMMHSVRNAQADSELATHWSFASPGPTRTSVPDQCRFENRAKTIPLPGDPKHLNRFGNAEVCDLSFGAFFSDSFVKRFGSLGACWSYGRFTKGSLLPCHTHADDESIRILSGSATCQVQDSKYERNGVQTAFVPQGKPHRFVNSGDAGMEMPCVYAGDEPGRVLLDNQYCSRLLPWLSGAEGNACRL